MMMRILCALAALLLVSCSGFQPTHSQAGAASSPSQQGRAIPVVIKMAFPHRRAARRSHSRRSPLYISQYTSTVKVTFAGGPTAFSQTYTVTPGSGACPNSGGTTTCNWTAAIAPGSYHATIVAYDASSNILSETEGVPEVIAAGHDNALLFTMYAVPTGVGVFLNTNTLSGTAGYFANVYDLNTPLSFSIYLYGVTEGGHVSIITGAGTPQLAVKRVSGTLDVGLTDPSGDPPVFTVSDPGGANFGLASIAVTASFPESDADICNLPGATCTSDPITFSGQELIAVCCGAGLQLFGIDGTGPLATIGNASSDFTGFAVDAKNDIFLASSDNSVSEYAPPYTSAAATITNGISDPVALTVSADGKLFVANLTAVPQTVTEYVAPFAGASPQTTIANVTLPAATTAPALAVSNYNQADSLAVATSAGVHQYDPPYASAAAIPNAVTDFFYGAFGSSYGLTTAGFTYCAPPAGCSATLIGTVPAGLGYALAIVSPVNSVTTPFAYVASTDGNVYAFNTNGTTPTTIAGDFLTQPKLMPQNIATDAHGNLAVIGYSANKVTVYTGVSATGSAAPTFGNPPIVLMQGIVNPSQVQIVP
jgi:hypothetical protein